MKKIIFILVIIASTVVIACNNGSVKKADQHDSASTGNTNMNATATFIDTSKLNKITPKFIKIDPKIAISLNTIVNNYLSIKKALASDNASDAASAGNEMMRSIANLEESLLTIEQKKVYDGLEDDLQENAEHISKNANDIAHQREHFSWMSEDIYDLVKTFGGERALFVDFCPMYGEGKGAVWLSEKIELENPYYGNKMLKCGNVKEIIKP